MPGKLFLIPNVIGDKPDALTAPIVNEVVSNTRLFLVENVRTARRYISALKTGVEIDDLHFEIVDKKTNYSTMPEFLQPVLDGSDAGIISEAGCPGIADPGAGLVLWAHHLSIPVIPLAGSSSVFMALMSSGLNGQAFCFHGYLPINQKERENKIKELETLAIKTGATQIFMETPYRNNQMISSLLKVLKPGTLLCMAAAIHQKEQTIATKSVSNWKKQKVDLNRLPAIFLLNNP